MKPTLTFIGHGSVKLKTSGGKTIYVDPFFPGDYSDSADILLITHNHKHHTGTNNIEKSEKCLTITPKEALNEGAHRSYNYGNIKIMAVQAYNENHDINECVGYVVEFDGIKIYCAGDTSKTDDMSDKLSTMELDYALLPIDGIFNMSPEEASECAAIINVRHAIPIHNDPDVVDSGQYSDKGIDKFNHNGKIVMKYGESLTLLLKNLTISY